MIFKKVRAAESDRGAALTPTVTVTVIVTVDATAERCDTGEVDSLIRDREGERRGRRPRRRRISGPG